MLIKQQLKLNKGCSILDCVAVLFLLGAPTMISSQIERLKKDSRDLGNYILRLRKQGRTDIISKVVARQRYLDEHIYEIEKTLEDKNATEEVNQ